MHVRVDSLMLVSRSVNSLQMLSRLQDWVQTFQAPLKKGFNSMGSMTQSDLQSYGVVDDIPRVLYWKCLEGDCVIV